METALEALREPGAVTELRILDAPGQGTVSGYFDAEHRKELAAKGKFPGALKLGRRWVVSRKALDAWLEGGAGD